MKDYYLGLDIGTNSVGWAVTDKQYNLCRYKKKTMWGIRLFESANTAADRRMKRAARRRLQRRKQRIDLLQELFAGEMAKVERYLFHEAECKQAVSGGQKGNLTGKKQDSARQK